MTFITWIKWWFDKVFKTKAREDFGIKQVNSTGMDALISACARVYAGAPDWLDDDVYTTNFAKIISSEIARLTTLAIKIEVDGSARADWLQGVLDTTTYFQLRHWVEYGAAYGTIILKPAGEKVTMVTPADFIAVDHDNEDITAAVFIDHAEDNGTYFTRLEYHRFEGATYIVTNRVYASKSRENVGDLVSIEGSPWSDIQPEAFIQGLTQPLFAVLRMPEANNVEIGSPLGLPVFYNSLTELKDLDIAYSRNADEIFDSARTVLMDSDMLLPGGQRVTAEGFEQRRKDMKLPKYIKSVYGNGQDEVYHEINPTLNTDTRITGINNLLSQIGYKCGFSNGYFVLDQKTGMITATQVEADDRRTIQTIKDVRDRLESCINALLYALNAFADLYSFAPAGAYEVVYDFGDITYNREEDRIRWWQYVQTNKVPAWYYFVKFEGMSEDDAKALVEEATPPTPSLFGEE